MPEAIKAFVSEKSIKLFKDNAILEKHELEARQEIRQEIYVKKIQIESRVLGDLAINHIVPTAIKYQNTLVDNVQGLINLLGEKEYDSMGNTQIDTIKKISKYINEIKVQVKQMVDQRKIANNLLTMEDKAEYYSQKVKPFLESIRYRIDKLELIIDDELWPLPKYRELLFI